jgi:hypothetical protein
VHLVAAHGSAGADLLTLGRNEQLCPSQRGLDSKKPQAR